MNTNNYRQKHGMEILSALFAGIFMIMINLSSLQGMEYMSREIENSYYSSSLQIPIFDDHDITPSSIYFNEKMSNHLSYEQDLPNCDLDGSIRFRAGGTEGGGDPTKVAVPIANGLIFLILLAGIYLLALLYKKLKIEIQD